MALSGPDNWGLMPPIKRRKPWWDKSPSGSYYHPSRPSMSGLPPLGDMPGFAPVQTPQTPMAGKKGLSLKNMINAMSKMKAPTGEDFSRVSGRAGGPRPTAPSPRALGVDALEMASADDHRKKWWKQWQGLMGA